MVVQRHTGLRLSERGQLRVIGSEKTNGLEPLAYLQRVIGNIAAADADEALDALLP